MPCVAANNPTCQCLGNSSQAGLHASGAKVPPALCTRMNVPCLMAWGDGFGVVVQSNATGMLMAHPSLDGWSYHQSKYRNLLQMALKSSWLIAPVRHPTRNSISVGSYQRSAAPISLYGGLIFVVQLHIGEPAAHSSHYRQGDFTAEP